MNPIVKIIIKSFFCYAIFIVLITMGNDLMIGKIIIFWKLIIESVLFGIIMSLWGVSIFIRRLKKIGINKFTTDSITTNQKKVVVIEISKADLLMKLKTDAKTGKMQLEVIDNTIILDYGISWTPWNTEIKIQINDFEPQLKKIEISCKPYFTPSIWVNGLNLEYVLYIENLIKS